jgi:hypothetical protein
MNMGEVYDVTYNQGQNRFKETHIVCMSPKKVLRLIIRPYQMTNLFFWP